MNIQKIHVNASTEYDILLGSGIIGSCGELISECVAACKAVIISDHTVSAIYGDIVENSLKKAGFEVLKHEFEPGERSKNISTLAGVLEYLAQNNVTRSDVVVALGGGVTGDMAGFAAAVYLRGIKYVQIPTTLLAAVDSSVGGKTAIDLTAGKNLAGAFHQPCMVICDTDTFNTLPEKVFADGVAESIKYGVIWDRALLNEFDRVTLDNIQQIVKRCVEIKAEIVEKDEFDTSLRAILNYGHTIGHAIEHCSNYSITHGHAVAIGMAIAARAAYKLELCSENYAPRICELLKLHGLPTECGFSAKELSEAALIDKKRKGNTITLVIPNTVGDTKLVPIKTEELHNFIASGLEDLK